MRVALELSSDAVTISLGTATSPEAGTTARDVVDAADAALSRSKADGRNRTSSAD
jgi:PleD family two-component response regulator